MTIMLFLLNRIGTTKEKIKQWEDVQDKTSIQI
jgi:hypothetical protein